MRWLATQFELARGGAATNLRPMEGLRGVAVLLVFLVHYSDVMAPLMAANASARAVVALIADIGNSGVDLFFMLSGYLIYGALLARAQAFRPFMARRIARIYPTFAVVFALYLALSLLLPAQSKLPAAGWACVLYLAQNFLLLPGLFPITPLIKVAWSLSYEMFFYLLLPLVVGFGRLRARAPCVRVALFAGAALALLAWCNALGGPARMVMFIGGMLLVEALRWPRMPVPNSAVALLALVAGLLAMLAHPGFALSAASLCVTFGIVCLACFRHPAARLGRALTWTPLRWLGNMSYSFYLLHGLALKGAALLLPAAAHGGLRLYALLLAPAFGLSCLPAALLFLAVERPASLVRVTGSRRWPYSPFADAARARRR